MKIFVRTIALLLVCFTLIATAVACNQDTDGPDDDDTAVVEGYDEYGRETDSLPKLNYMGEEITMLYWSDVEHQEFDADSITGDNVNDAIFERNSEIERRLNVELKFISTKGNVSNMNNFVRYVTNAYKADTHSFDLIAAYSRTEAMLAIQGYLVDMSEIEDSYINLEKPWWPKQLIETVTFGDSLYFISGDCSTNTLHMMYGLFFNKNMLNREYNAAAKEAGYEGVRDEKNKEILTPASQQLYQLVYEGKWTLDKLIEYTSGLYRDSDNSGGRSLGDQFGFVTEDYHMDAFYVASNMRYVSKSETDMLVISPDYGSSKTVKLVNKLGAWVNQDCCTVLQRDGISPETTFKNGKSLFIQNRVRYAERTLQGVEDFDYGLVPTPKYDEKQKNYYTCMGNPISLYGIYVKFDERGNKAETLSMMTAIIECWGSEGYRRTTPQIFEVNMQLKYSETQYETDMFEYVRSAVTFDLGRFFSNDLAFMSEMPSHTAANGGSWSASYRAYKTSLNAKMAKIVEAFESHKGLI